MGQAMATWYEMLEYWTELLYHPANQVSGFPTKTKVWPTCAGRIVLESLISAFCFTIVIFPPQPKRHIDQGNQCRDFN